MILVTGATGLNGTALVRKLSAKGVPLRALVRNAAKAAEIAALPNVEIAIADMAKPETLPAALAGVDRAMLNSSADPAMVEVQSNFIAAAAKAGVRHVVKLSGIMPELDSPFRFARMHGEIEKRLEASGMAFTHLRAGEFMPSYFRQVPMILAKGALFLPMENQRIASIDIGDLAEIAALVLTNPGHEGKIYPLTGPEALTMTEVAERLSAATGKTIKYINVPPEDVKKAQVAAGVPPYIADALAELFAERRKGKESQVWPIAQTLLGRRPTSFAEFAARNAAIFRGEQPAPRL
ncbi:MAG: SDR family oxidoreductase [Xanthobacteraceae bacterium]